MNAPEFLKCSCPDCGGHVEFPTEATGAEVPCPHCQGSLTLAPDETAPSEPELATSAGLTPGQIAAAFTDGIRRTRVSIGYQVGLLIVTGTMITLPLIYLTLVAGAGWCVYWWATHGTFLFGGGGGGRVMLLKLVAYVTPLVVGMVVVFFMFKPLLARRAPAAQPLVFALVRCVCDAVGAPFPKRIDVDCQLNASASFRRGLRSFLGSDLVLTIGMPLVAGLSARQLAGILAHEFGHFTQGFGMRLTYLIRRINAWFARIAYERDAWDVALDQWAEEGGDWRLMLVANLARLAVWMSRLILKLLLFIGHGIGCFMLRQMEYDADSYEIKLAGSDAFESAAKQLHVLGAALGHSYKEMRVGWNLNKRLPENFPGYLMNHFRKMPPTARTKIEDTAGMGRTGFFDTHPSDGDRIRRARRAGEPGVFQLEAPALALFANADGLGKLVTRLHYEEDLGIPLELVKFAPVEPLKTVEA